MAAEQKCGDPNVDEFLKYDMENKSKEIHELEEKLARLRAEEDRLDTDEAASRQVERETKRLAIREKDHAMAKAEADRMTTRGKAQGSKAPPVKEQPPPDGDDDDDLAWSEEDDDAESGDTVPVAKPKPVATAKPLSRRKDRGQIRADHSVENLTEMLAQDPWNDADVRRVMSLGLSADASYSDIDKGIELHERTGPEAQALRFSLLGQCLVAMIVKAVPANTTCLDDLARAVRDLRIFNDEDLDTKSQRRLKFKRAHMALYLAMLCEYYDITMNRIRISDWRGFSDFAISCTYSGGGRPSWRLVIGLHLRALRDHFTAVTDWDDSLILNKPTNLQRALQSASP